MKNTKWIYRTENFHETNINFDKDIENILFNRGILTAEDMERFLNGTIENLMSPFSFVDVDKAIDRIIKAIENKESIWIYGDYDVDGITSTSISYLALKELGADVKYYIPLRDEGYGLNKSALSHIKENGGDLVITVDCGITSNPEVDHCNSLGMDIIITDHHEIIGELPKAHAIINPKREENIYDYKILAGVGTAFILLLGLYEKLNQKEKMYNFLDIVAIGTIADIVPIKGDNRLIVKDGLERLKNSKNLGLNMLMKRLFENPQYKNFNTYDVGFIIAPIFNSVGRLEDAKIAIDLLINPSHVECDKIISNLLEKNSERKKIQDEVLEKALDEVEKENLKENNVIVVAKENFHHGVIGIVASKILDKFYKPTILMEIKPDEGVATASCRSTESFNILDALNSMKELFIKYGGHAAAAGFTIPIENIESFSNRINEFAKNILIEEDTKKPIKIDSILPFEKISFDFYDKLSKLEPFGFGNSTPIFVVKNCKYTNIRLIGKDKSHLMMDIIKNNLEFKNSVWFSNGDMLENIVESSLIDVAFKLKVETYKDKYMYKLQIEDIKISSDKEKNKYLEYSSLYNMKFPIKSIFYTRRTLNNEKLNINFILDDVTVNIGQTQIGYLDNQTKIILKKLREYYGYEFDINIEEIIKKEENFNVLITINKNKKFKSLSTENSNIFKDIKQFLIGELEYNSLQKTVLSLIFKEKKDVVVKCGEKRGIDTLIKTIQLYFEVVGKKVLLVKNHSEKTEGFDFYIYYGEEEISNLDYNLAIFPTTNSKNYENCKYIEDIYTVPKNIVLVNEEELVLHENIYSKRLPNFLKAEIAKKIKANERVYATDDILTIL